MSKEMREQINRVKNWKQFLNEDINESEFGFGEFSKPKTEIWIQLMNRARKDGLLSDLHYGDKRIQNLAKELADEFEKMEEPNRQSNKDLYLGMFYDRIPRWAWGDKIKKFNEHYVEKTFNEKQVVSMLVDAVMTSMGDEWIPQEDENFKSFLSGYGLLSIFLDEYGYDDY
jgi:hypothetical protein